MRCHNMLDLGICPLALSLFSDCVDSTKGVGIATNSGLQRKDLDIIVGFDSMSPSKCSQML